MREIFKSFLKDESGASAGEYALILAIVGAGIAGAAGGLGYLHLKKISLLMMSKN